MTKLLVVFRRELRSYFATPLAYVFIVIFLVLASVFTFQVGGLFERGQADLQPFFNQYLKEGAPRAMIVAGATAFG